MNLFVKFLIAALVIAVLLPFTILKGKDGRPLMSFDQLKAPDIALPKVPDSANLPSVGDGSSRKDIVYLWRDEKGSLHFSSTPPPAGVEYTSKGYDPNTNLIQSVKIKEKEPEPVEVVEQQVKKPSDIGSPYSPEKVEKLFDDAQKVQQVLEERLKQQEAMIGR